MKKIACLISIGTLVCSVAHADTPKLVLQITVDGLRADLIDRYQENFVESGFNYLRENGMVYANAHYLHANTETIVGHTTLATGATPAVHGMVGNVWYYPDTGELGYNIEDPEAPMLPTREQSSIGAQVDPAQKRARSSGRSPQGILAPTFSDTLKMASAGQARIFGVSGKDRSAVAMAGKTGTAYWYSTDTGDFQTSRYYMNDYPQWVKQWNNLRLAEELDGQHWSLLLPPDKYQPGRRDDRSYEVDLKGYGRTFPHAFGSSDDPLFYTRVLVSPEGDRLLLNFTKSLIEAEQLGQDAITDYLSVSFSGVDAVNHFFGPGSLENEDVVLQLDRILADLFSFVEQKIGLENTLVVLSADHGMAEMPEYAAELGYESGRWYSEDLLAAARERSEAMYGEAALVKDFFRPYLYLDHQVLARLGLDKSTVAAELAAALSELHGIGGAVPSSQTSGKNVSGPVASVQHNHHPRRSGDIYIFQRPYWFMFDRGPVAAMHGSPWAYDTHVPIMFAGTGIKSGTVYRRVHPIDVAPTLSALLGISPPAAALGSVLVEVTDP